MKIDLILRELIKPSSPTPSHLKNYKLSLFDQLSPPQYVPLILFYSSEETTEIQQSSLLRILLSHALTQFYPLAGRMEGESSVNCNDEGVDYIETRVNTHLLDIIEGSEIEILDQFIPYKLSDKELSTEKLLAIQVNFFSCGGVVISICISHRISDGSTLSSFIKGWAANARGETNLVCPSFISASLFPPREPLGYKPVKPVPGQGLVTRRLIFSPSTIYALKDKVLNSSSEVQVPTRVEVITALIWKCAIAQECCTIRTSVAFHPVNIRRRMVPALPDHSFGNLFLMANAVAEGEEDLASMVAKLRDGIGTIDSDYIRARQGENGFEVVMENMRRIGKLISSREVKLLRFSSWCGFSLYEADFGWGKPIWVSSASMVTRNSIFLMDSKCHGGVEAWVTMDEQDMYLFEQNPELQASISRF